MHTKLNNWHTNPFGHHKINEICYLLLQHDLTYFFGFVENGGLNPAHRMNETVNKNFGPIC